MAAAGHPLDATRRPGHHELPDLAGREPADPGARPARRVAGRRPRPGHDPAFPGTHLLVVRGRQPTADWPAVLDAGRPRVRTASARSTSAPRRPIERIRWRTSGSSRSSVHEATPILRSRMEAARSEAHAGGEPLRRSPGRGDRRSRLQRERAAPRPRALPRGVRREARALADPSRRPRAARARAACRRGQARATAMPT